MLWFSAAVTGRCFIFKDQRMAKTRAEKEAIVASLADRLRRMKGAAFCSSSSFTMEDANKLRAKARDLQVEIFVAKKTLLALAAKEVGIEGMDKDAFDGSVLAAVGYGDEISPAKLLREIGKEKEAMKLLAGVLEGKMIPAAQVAQLAALPSRQELLAKIVGSIAAPLSGLVQVLAGNPRAVVRAIDAVAKTK